MFADSTEWHEWRRGGVGASEVAAILGICPYSTPHQVWLVKTGRAKGFEGNSFTQHGKEQEAKARQRYELINMEDIQQDVFAVHPMFSMCRASLDGLSADGKTILEIKCPKGTELLSAAKSGKVLDHYWPQVQYQLAVTGADLCHFFVYHSELREDALVEVRPDIDYQAKIIVAVIEFWNNHVLADVAPPLTDRDVKVIPETEANILSICNRIKTEKELLSKSDLDKLKAKAVELAGHPKIRCGSVQISTVLRNGKFSYHKLTIQGAS